MGVSRQVAAPGPSLSQAHASLPRPGLAGPAANCREKGHSQGTSMRVPQSRASAFPDLDEDQGRWLPSLVSSPVERKRWCLPQWGPALPVLRAPACSDPLETGLRARTGMSARSLMPKLLLVCLSSPQVD